MITPKRPSGFNEFLPAEQMAFNAMIAVIRLVYEQHGYSPIETPAIELTSILLAKEGGETAKQVYRFTKGDNDLALRFDLTVPLARYVAEHYHELTIPFRRYQIQEVWRAEKAQAGRYRQFYQCDIDTLGTNDLLADADILITAHETFLALGLKDAVFSISHRGLLSGLLAEKKLNKFTTSILRSVDKLSKQPEKNFSEELSRLGINKKAIEEILNFVKIKGTAQEVLKKLQTINLNNKEFIKAFNDLKKLNQYLLAVGLRAKDFMFDLKITRGLDYYTGLVFETFLTKNPEIGSICSGGRYDNLLSHYSKANIPGVGISIGLSRLFNALKPRMVQGPATPAQILIIPLASEVINYSLDINKILNKANLNAFVYPGTEKMSKQLAYANKLKIPVVIIVGEDEVKKQRVTIKNMTSGQQTTIGLAKAVAQIKKMI